jgi:hypothetical protein
MEFSGTTMVLQGGLDLDGRQRPARWKNWTEFRVSAASGLSARHLADQIARVLRVELLDNVRTVGFRSARADTTDLCQSGMAADRGN